MHHVYIPKGICPTCIEFDLDGGVVTNVSFRGGCNGNSKAVSALIDGLEVSRIAEKLEGITCGFKRTSCADQLVQGLKKAQAREEANIETKIEA